jgi:hypothetical protein
MYDSPIELQVLGDVPDVLYHIYMCVCDKLFFTRALFITESSILYVYVFVDGKVYSSVSYWSWWM